ncbi:MAG: 5-(carboxyamino)imidazole ribonucleotide synthase [Cyanobacteria bacterium P01_E01_bin.6]
MGDRVGIIGGGQLAWMVGLAAQHLNIDLFVQTPNPTDSAVSVATETYYGAIADATVTEQLAQHCDVITFENEFVDLQKLTVLERQGIVFYPKLSSLEPLLDKYHQRQFFRTHHIPTPDFYALEGDSPLETAPPSMLIFPIVLKSRRLGYDGQGTHILTSKNSLQTVLDQSRHAPVDWLLEEFVPFEKELAMMAARSVDGDVVMYPVVETQQEQQVCRRVFILPGLPTSVIEQAEAIARTVLEQLDVVGIFGFEFFLTPSGKILVNELAPRTHNSGHYTIDTCSVSQFEQQLRAVCRRPLISPRLLSNGAVMVNLLGFESSQRQYIAARQSIAALPRTHVHWYGKAESRPGRKLGHVTTLLEGDDPHQLRLDAQAIANQIEALWYPHQ